MLKHTCLVAILAAAYAQDLQLSYATDGSFNITHDGHPFLSGGEYMVGNASSSSGDLVSTAATAGNGNDALGAYQSVTNKWARKGATDKVVMETSFRTYEADGGVIVFEQNFPLELNLGTAITHEAWTKGQGAECRISTTSGFKLTKSADGYTAYTPKDASGEGVYDSHDHMYCGEGSNTHAPTVFSGNIDANACKDKCTQMNCTCYDYSAGAPPKPSGGPAQTLFPGFHRNSGPSDGLGCFSYHGVFPKLKSSLVKDYKESHQGGAPLAIYDKTNARYREREKERKRERETNAAG
jgi:hypothetical protein